MLRLLLVLLMAFGLLQGQSPHELSVAARAGDKAAFEALVAMGSSGNPEANYWLGMMYQLGAGVAKASATAVGFYRKAAEQGYAPAQSSFGWMYEKGEGVAKNPATAVKWYRLAANQGNEDAQFSLGAAYDFGSGVAKDAATAIQWYRKAAEQGLAGAQYFLGLRYAEGEGVPKNLVLGYMWFDLAAAQGNEQARQARDYTAGEMTSAQIAEARALSSGQGASPAEPPRINAAAAPRKTPPPAPNQLALTTAQIATKISPSVVVIQGKTTSGDVLGSGFIVSKDGKIVTNLHVVRDMTSATVQMANGEIFDSVSVLGVDERRDLAILQVAGFSLPALELGNSDGLTVGEPLVAVGSPRGLEGTVTAGILSSVRESGDGLKILQTDASVNPGNSGGPLANARGQVIGVVSSKLRSAENLNFAIPINYVRGLLASLDGPMPLDQMRSRLSASTPTKADTGPTLKETLDWPKEKIPLGVVAWVQSNSNGVKGVVNRQSQAWSTASCTVVIGTVDVVTTNIPPLAPDRFVVTERNTLPLSDVNNVFVAKMDNPTPQDIFVSGDKASPTVVLMTSSTFVHVMSSNDPNYPPQSNRVNQLYLPFNDEQLANRVRDAFKRAADLCRKKEAF